MAAPHLTEKRVIQVSIEGVAKGTISVATFTDILAFDPLINPTSDFIQRPGTGLFLGNDTPGVVAARMGQCTFGVEMRSNGSNGMEAGLAILLQSSAYKKTGEVYQVHSTFTNQETITINVFQDGVKKVLYGAMGTFTIEGEVGGRIMLNFDFTGLYFVPDDVALPVSFTPSTAIPMVFGGGAFTYGGLAMKISKFSLDAGNNVIGRADAAVVGGTIHNMITNYDPTFSFDPEADDISTYSPHAIWIAGTEAAVLLTMTDGTVNVVLSCPQVQHKAIPEGSRDGVDIYEIETQCNHSSGNDAVILTASAVV